MTVLLVAEQLRRPVPGGIGTSLRGLLQGLAQHPGADVTLYASQPPGRGVDPLAEWGRPVRTVHLPGPLLTRAWDRGVLRAPGGYEVVHAMSFAAPPRDRGRRSAFAMTVHDLLWRRLPETATGRGRRWHEAALERALHQQDLLLVPSAWVAGELVAAGADPAIVRTVPWGADHLPAPDGPGTDALLARAGVRGPYLLTVGTLEPRKNLLRLAAAYRQARPDLPEPWPLLIVGPAGWGEGAPERLAGDGVQLIGAVSAGVLRGLYERARLFASVPLLEGYGLPVLEAMAAGVPVVASSGVPSIEVAPGERAPALLVDPRQPEEIARALVRGATDEPLRAELVTAGSSFTAARTWRSAAAGYLEAWATLR